MDNQQYQPQPIEQPVPPPPAVVKRKKSPIMWVLLALLLSMLLACGGLYALAQNELNETKAAHAATQEKLKKAETDLKTATDKLAAATFLPDGNKMSPQCSESNNNQTYIAPVNKQAIEGYKVYLVNCLSDLVAGRTNTGKVIAFKVGSDGTQSFAFGAGSGEPYCISGKITTPTAADNISKATGLPVCKTF